MSSKSISDHIQKFNINAHYANRYVKFINYCIYTNAISPPQYVEKHHILPKASHLFPEFRQLSVFKWNRVDLSARQHYIAHLILCKVFIDPAQSYACEMGLWLMSNKKSLRTIIESRKYETLKLNVSKHMRENNPMHNDVFKAKSIAKMKLSWTPERRLEQSIRRMGTCTITPEGIEKLSNRWKGKKRPQTEEQIAKIISSTSSGKFVTPFGIFDSPGQASRCPLNVENLSRFIINKRCKGGLENFSFIPNGRQENRGHYKKINQ